MLRTWAFSDGGRADSSDGLAAPLQIRPGQYVESTFVGLDRVVALARERGLRLVLCLTNFWKDYGGCVQRLRARRPQSRRTRTRC